MPQTRRNPIKLSIYPDYMLAHGPMLGVKPTSLVGLRGFTGIRFATGLTHGLTRPLNQPPTHSLILALAQDKVQEGISESFPLSAPG
eukprot:1631249-Pyramimonas_sp.AAC.1